jgi:ribosomal protein L22
MLLRGTRLSAQKAAWWLTWCAASRGQGAEHPGLQPEEGRGIIKKVLESAIANAEHNEGADIDALKVKTHLRRSGPGAEALHRARQGSWQPYQQTDLSHHCDGWRLRKRMGQKIHPIGFRLERQP